VRRHLGDAILNGAYAPGSRLEEAALALEFGVSRTPVREALHQLAAAGIVTIRPNAGAVVLAVDGDRLPMLLEAIVEMETLLTRLAAARLPLAERLKLRAALADCGTAVAADDLDRYVAGNRLFHEVIVKGAQNPDLQSAVTALRIRAAPFRKAQFRTPGRAARLHADQLTVLQAIERRSPDDAAAAMRHTLEEEMAAILVLFPPAHRSGAAQGPA